MKITMQCPRCESQHIKIPSAAVLGMAPPGYAWDATLVLVTCCECGFQPTMTDATVIEHA